MKPPKESNAQKDSSGKNTKRAAKRRKTKRKGDVSPYWDFSAHVRSVNSKKVNNPPVRSLNTTPKNWGSTGMSFDHDNLDEILLARYHWRKNG